MPKNTKNTNAPVILTERYVALATKSAQSAGIEADACEAACAKGDAKLAKRAKRNCEAWLEQVKLDAARAEGAEAQARGETDVVVPEAERAITTARGALERAQAAYRALKMPAATVTTA